MYRATHFDCLSACGIDGPRTLVADVGRPAGARSSRRAALDLMRGVCRPDNRFDPSIHAVQLIGRQMTALRHALSTRRFRTVQFIC
ncbi:MAG: hypothetical protein RL701_1772 [Pseudomonadota bacterium]